jgi:outer membrane protein OmpA-like peptidoglycan-associated protein
MPPFEQEIELFNKSSFGIFFSKKDYDDHEKYKMDILTHKLKWWPQLVVKLEDSTAYKKWVRFFTTFKAPYDCSYIIIGNHLPCTGTMCYFTEFEQENEMYKRQYDHYKKGKKKHPGSDYLDFYIDELKIIPFEDYLLAEELPKNQPVELRNILFKTNSWQLNENSFESLNQLIKYLKKNSAIKIEISGHTDNTGEENWNQELSLKRANAVKAYLSDNGIKNARISTKGYGSNKPVAPNYLESGKAKNRRIEIVLK